jgi:hypothetical protein
VLYPSLILAGLVIGLVFGRWWTLGAAAAVGTWIALATEVDEVPGWYLRAGYALMVAVGIVTGVLVRKRLPRHRVR